MVHSQAAFAGLKNILESLTRQLEHLKTMSGSEEEKAVLDREIGYVADQTAEVSKHVSLLARE